MYMLKNNYKLGMFDKKFEWPVRILFTVAIIFTLLCEQQLEEHFYPMNAFMFTLLALWFYFYKIRIAAVLLLLFQIFLAYTHGASFSQF
jgi:hypothetical protein